MKNIFLFIALFMAATALTSGEYNPNAARPNSTLSAQKETAAGPNISAGPSKPTPHHNTTTTTTAKTTTPHHNTTTTTAKTTTPHHNTTTTTTAKTTTPHHNTTTTTAKTTTPHHNTTTTTAKTTTPHHNTTTTTAKTTTPHHNTTTTTAKTTTPHHNTTTTTAKTTTPHHNITTTTATTPMPRPTPPANTTVGSYNVTDIDHNLCIMANFALKIRVNDSEVNGTFIVQPAKTNVSGTCDKTVASLFLTFDEGSVVLKFRNNMTSKMVYVETLEYDLTYAFKSGVSKDYSGKNESLQLFAAAAEHSYSCKAISVFMGQGVHLDFTKNRVQAYNIKKNNFGKTDLCKADQPNYGIPIAVAIIIVILIVIVVIAYCVSRKRRTSGYQSL